MRRKRSFHRIMETTQGLLWPLWIGLVNLFRKPVTIRYPHEKPDLPANTRMMLFNDIDDCIGCLQCARVCPVDCITIETYKADVDLGKTSDGHKKRLFVTVFDIDMYKCCYCNLCTEVCPTECLVMTPYYEGSMYNRYDLIMHFSRFSPQARAEVQARLPKPAGRTGLFEVAQQPLYIKKPAQPESPQNPSSKTT